MGSWQGIHSKLHSRNRGLTNAERTKFRMKKYIGQRGDKKVGGRTGFNPDTTVYYTLGLDPQISVFQVR